MLQVILELIHTEQQEAIYKNEDMRVMMMEMHMMIDDETDGGCI